MLSVDLKAFESVPGLVDVPFVAVLFSFPRKCPNGISDNCDQELKSKVESENDMKLFKPQFALALHDGSVNGLLILGLVMVE